MAGLYCSVVLPFSFIVLAVMISPKAHWFFEHIGHFELAFLALNQPRIFSCCSLVNGMAAPKLNLRGP
jgi:hypothetical protein